MNFEKMKRNPRTGFVFTTISTPTQLLVTKKVASEIVMGVAASNHEALCQ